MGEIGLIFVDEDGNDLPIQDGIQHVRQFARPWRVRVAGDWGGSVILIGDSVAPLPLQRSLDSSHQEWELPSGSRKAQEQAKQVASSAGLITATLADISGCPIPNAPNAALFVHPASLTEVELDRLLEDIGLLAVAAASYSYRNVASVMGGGPGGEPIEAPTNRPGTTLTAQRLLQLGDLLRHSWPQILRRPLQSLRWDVGPVSRRQLAAKGPSLLKLTLQPERQSFIGQRSTETTYCPENCFLRYLFDHYLIGAARSLAAALEWQSPRPIRSMPAISKRDAERRHVFIMTARARIEEASKRNVEENQLRTRLAAELRALADWAQTARDNSFLRQIELPQELPEPTLRLIGSATYGPIFSLFSRLKIGGTGNLQSALQLYNKVSHRQVRPTWNLYEIWCVVRIYGYFVLDLGFEVPEGLPSLFDRLELRRGMLELPRNQTFVLTRTIKASDAWDRDQTITLELSYEPELINNVGQPRRPDIRLSVIEGARRSTFFFDAKYRSYSRQGLETVIDDVIGVARDKYLRPFNAAGSYILHTDRSLDFWGEIPFQRKLEEAYDADIGLDEYAGHRYGAISLKPDPYVDGQLSRLARMILHYFGSFPTACLTCGKFLRKKIDVRANWDPDHISETELIDRIIGNGAGAGTAAAAYCSCPDCGDFWVVQICYGPHHRLIKSWDTLHRKSDHREYERKWMYICPRCGSDPHPSELGSYRDFRDDYY